MREKEQQPPLPDNSKASDDLPEDELNLIGLLYSLFRKKILILVVLAMCTLASIFYSVAFMPVYRANIGFVPTDELELSSYFHAFKMLDGEDHWVSSIRYEKRKLMVKNFLNTIRSKELQEKVFIEGKFFERFADTESDAKMREVVLGEVNKSIKLQSMTNSLKSSYKELFGRLSVPFYLEMVGSKPKVMSDFLNSLGEAAIDESALKIKQSLLQEIETRLLTNRAKLENLSSINNSQYLKKIRYLSENLEIAENLGIVENNLANNKLVSLFSDGEERLPLWFYYGQNALKKKLSILKNRPRTGQNVERMAELSLSIENLSKLDLSKTFFNPVAIIKLSVPPTKAFKHGRAKIITAGVVIGVILGFLLAFVSLSIEQWRQRSEAQFDKK